MTSFVVTRDFRTPTCVNKLSPIQIFVFDSLYPSVSSCVKRQIAALLATKHNVITLKHMDVQMQSGTYDMLSNSTVELSSEEASMQTSKCLHCANKVEVVVGYI